MSHNQTPHTFILFQKLQDENHHGADLPVAALVRISESLRDRIVSSALDVESDFFRRVELNVAPADIRWLSIVAFDKENNLAAVEGWFNPQIDKVIYAGDSENMEDVDYDGPCQVFSGEGIPISFLTLEKYQRRILLGAGGETNSHWNLRTLCENWEHVASQIDTDETPAHRQSHRA